MAEEKEQLKIEAELDTSKLKQDAKQGFDAISKEEKKVQQDSKQTSNAIDNIGTASRNVGKTMQTTAQQSTSALKSISNEAKNTTNQIDNIAKATKQIKLQQALGMINRGISELAPVGRMVGSAIGMSDDETSLVGSALTGAASGAMMGAMTGNPLIAAGGALIGAATSLISAADELKKSAKDKLDESKRTQSQIIESIGLQDLQKEASKMSRSDLLKEVERMKGVKAERESRLRELAFTEINNGNAEKVQSDIAETTALIEHATNVLAIYEDALKKSNEVKVGNDTGQWGEDFIAGATADFFKDTNKWQEELKNKPKPTNYDVGTWGEDFIAGATADFFKDTNKWKKELADDREKNITTSEGLLKSLGTIENVKLSDSLTRVGGGSGYGVQMNGIATKVTTITNTLKSMLDELKKMNSNESVNSSEGVFV